MWGNGTGCGDHSGGVTCLQKWHIMTETRPQSLHFFVISQRPYFLSYGGAREQLRPIPCARQPRTVRITECRARNCPKYWSSLNIKSVGTLAVLRSCPNHQASPNYRSVTVFTPGMITPRLRESKFGGKNQVASWKKACPCVRGTHSLCFGPAHCGRLRKFYRRKAKPLFLEYSAPAFMLYWSDKAENMLCPRMSCSHWKHW